MPVSRHRKSTAKKPVRKASPRSTGPLPESWDPGLALAMLRAGDAAGSLTSALARLSSIPGDVDALHIAGVSSTRLGQHAAAIRYLLTASGLRPEDASILINLGRAQSDASELDAARASYARATELEPENANAFFNLGNVLSRQERFERAVTSYEAAIRLSPVKRADIYNNYGYALASLSRHADAIEAYKQSIAADPSFADAHNNLGVSQVFLKQAAPALESFRMAGGLGGKLSDGFVNRAGALFELDEIDDALECTRQAIELVPRDAEAWRIRGICLAAKGRHEDAMAALDHAVACDPGSGDAKFSRAIQRLRCGGGDGAWQDYESRWESSFLRRSRRGFSQPQWDGMTLADGKTLLVHAEQGFGDTLQFIRYASVLTTRAPRIIFEVQPALRDLIQRSAPGGVKVIARGESLPNFDYHLPLMSCPGVFGEAPGRSAGARPYLVTTPEKVTVWQARLGDAGSPLVGVVSSGSRTHREDRHRSIPLTDLLRALPAGPKYVILQPELREKDRIALESRDDLVHFGDLLTDFDETAALCSLMDHVVSVDTSVAHLAGALGVRTHLLLPFNPDFRWLLSRSDSPWYPSMRLYRQRAMADWCGPLSEVGQAFTGLIETPFDQQSATAEV